MLSGLGKMPTWLVDSEAVAGFLLDARGELLIWHTADLSLSGVETPGQGSELTGEAGLFGHAEIPVTCLSFLGVASGGASQISTSLEPSESSDEITSGSCWACWTGATCGASLTCVLSKLLLEDVPSAQSEGADSGCPAVLDVSTLVTCTGRCERESEKEVVGLSPS